MGLPVVFIVRTAGLAAQQAPGYMPGAGAITPPAARRGAIMFSGRRISASMASSSSRSSRTSAQHAAAAEQGLAGQAGAAVVADVGVQRGDQADGVSISSRQRASLAVMPSMQCLAQHVHGALQQADRIEQLVGDQRFHDVELQLRLRRPWSAPGRCRSLRRRPGLTASGITGLTLPGMIELPGWRGGRLISLKPVRGRWRACAGRCRSSTASPPGA